MTVRKMRRVSAERLAVDPLAAARLLLGAVLTGRGVGAVIVEVEAYGGPRTGPGRTPRRIRSAAPVRETR